MSNGLDVESPKEARAHVDFEVRSVEFDGDGPRLIQVSPPSEVARGERAVDMVFELPEYGFVLLEQRLPHLSQKDLEARADAPDAPDEAFQMVGVRGTEGLLVSWDGLGRVMWIEGGVLFDLTGPGLTPKDVLSLAEKV